MYTMFILTIQKGPDLNLATPNSYALELRERLTREMFLKLKYENIQLFDA